MQTGDGRRVLDPAVAPAVARDLGVNLALIGLYISTVYGVGILSALFSPRFIQSYGAVRESGGACRNALHAGDRSGRIHHGGGTERC